MKQSINVRRWRHKKNGKELRVLPWWECIEPIVSDDGIKGSIQLKGEEIGMDKDRKFKIGAIIQIGWLLENECGVWFGVGPGAQKEFEDLGEWKPKKGKKK